MRHGEKWIIIQVVMKEFVGYNKKIEEYFCLLHWVKTLQPGNDSNSFWLNKGRIAQISNYKVFDLKITLNLYNDPLATAHEFQHSGKDEIEINMSSILVLSSCVDE